MRRVAMKIGSTDPWCATVGGWITDMTRDDADRNRHLPVIGDLYFLGL
jgi:hypothetical protein